MLKKFFTVLLCSSVLLSCSASLQNEKGSEETNTDGFETEQHEEGINYVKQNIDYTDSNKIIYNLNFCYT